jgi:Amt family ammonium transporter
MIASFGKADWIAQIGSLAIVGLFTLIMTLILVKFTALLTVLRVSEEDESIGLDVSAHGERAYDHTS